MNESLVVLDDIAFAPDIANFLKAIRIDEESELAAGATELFEWAAPFIRPKALHRISFINERDGDSVAVDNVVFTSRALVENLTDVERVFAFVATCGTELEGVAYDRDPFMGPFWLDGLKAMALQTAMAALKTDLEDRYGLGDFVAMNPGSADVDVWPIEQQKSLFALCGEVEDLIGVTLTDSYLMLPTKSVSGVYFETDKTFINCQLCTREMCPSRRAKYTGRV